VFDALIESHDSIDDMKNIIRIGYVILNFVVLINPKFVLYVERILTILKTEESHIDHKLIHRGFVHSCLKIMDSKESLLDIKVDGIWTTVAVIRVKQNYFGLHTIANGIIDIHTKGLTIVRKFNPKLNHVMRKSMKFAAALRC
jgi:hypothetical protein